MYVRLPRKLCPLSSYFTDDRGRSIFTYVCNPNEEDLIDLEGQSFFMEHRRENFSDVCHAKLVSQPGFDNVGPVAMTSLAPRVYHTFRVYIYNRWTDMQFRAETPSSDGQQHTWRALCTNGQQAYRLEVRAYCRSDARVGGIRISAHLYAWVSGSYGNNRIAYTDSSGRTSLYYSYRWTNSGRTISESDESRFFSPASIVKSLVEPGQRFDTLSVSRKLFDMYPGIIRGIYDELVPGYAGMKFGTVSGYTPEKPWASPDLNLSQGFVFHEPGVIMEGIDDILYGRGFEAYWRNVGIQNSYLEAVRSVPRLNDNSISNLLEIGSFIKKLVVDHKVELPRSLSDTWLQYRYRYTTGKLDAKEAIKFVHRHMDLPSSGPFKCYGIHHVNFDGVDATFRCSLHSKPKDLDKVGKVWRALYTYGLSPSFYTIWDMIPYSFIVDWFLPIGEVLSVWDAEREYNGKYDITDINFSISYLKKTDAGLASFYTRWWSCTPIALQGRYFLENDPSSKTVGMRILDAGSLIIGRKGG